MTAVEPIFQELTNRSLKRLAYPLGVLRRAEAAMSTPGCAGVPRNFAIVGSLNLCSTVTLITLDVKRLRALAIANSY